MLRLARVPAAFLLLCAVSLALVLGGAPSGPTPAAAAACADYANQAAAQAAKDTRDGNGNGIYCEDLPCPCAGKNSGSPDSKPSKPEPPKQDPTPTPNSADPKNCTIIKRTVRVGLSKTKYPEVRAHWEQAIREGWPRLLKIHRKGASTRRAKLLAGIPTRPGRDRDEYPMAMARTSIKADVAYVDSSQNRGAGSVQGVKLRRYCSGQRFTITWY